MSVQLAIIGGGASGLAAAVTAASLGVRDIVVLEKLPRVGKKILATGNGRCNLSHTGITARDYAGSYDPAGILETFGTAEDFFASLGLYCRTDAEGRIYPYSMTAAAVLDALRMQLDVSVFHCGAAAEALYFDEGVWNIRTPGETIRAQSVIFAAGGYAAPKQGTDGSAWAMLRELQIPVEKPRPILCPLRTDSPLLRSLKGMRVRCKAVLTDGVQSVQEEHGEVQFTETALSGICLFDLSARLAEENLHEPAIVLDLLPDETMGDTVSRLYAMQSVRISQTAEDMLTGLLHRSLAKALLQTEQIRPDTSCAALSTQQMLSLAETLHSLRFPVTGTGDFTQAQATAGGVCGEALDENLQVKRCPGLYVTGEAVDVHSRCGGYHLHWCWASGAAAASAAARMLSQKGDA